MSCPVRRAGATRGALLACFLSFPAGLGAQMGATPDPGDLVWRDVEVLIGAGLVTTTVVGQRPWSWTEIARILEESAPALDTLGRRGGESDRVGYLQGVRERLARRVDAHRGARWGLEEAGAEVAWLDSPARGFPENGLGGVDASLNPLALYRQGRPLADGTTTTLELFATAAPAPWLTLQVAPMGTIASSDLPGSDSDPDRTRLRLQRASTRLLLGNLALTVGREPVFWGPGSQSGILLSRNARPFDMVQVAGDSPFHVPGPFRHLGPTRVSVFVAEMGEHREFPGALLVGAKMSVLPHPNLELGAAVLNLQGGEGAPEASFGERLSDILLLPDLFVSHDYLFSEKIAGGDVRLRVPRLDGLEVYLEGALTDFDLRRPGQTFWMEAAYQAGVLLPRMGGRGEASLRLEAYHTGVRFYRHHFFTSGLTLDGDLVGSGLGPDGWGALVEWVWESSGLLTLRGSWENRSGDVYQVLNEPFEHNIVLDEDLPDERRLRLTGVWRSLRPTPSFLLEVEAGVERVDGFAHARGEGRTNALVRLSVGWQR